MDLLSFARVLRRSLRLLVVAAFVGALFGVVGGVLASRRSAHAVKTVHYFSATQTLGLDSVAAAQAPTAQLANLDSIALLTSDPAVTAEVGKKLGGDGVRLALQTGTSVPSQGNTLSITAVAGTRSEAVTLSEAFSVALLDVYQQQLMTASADQSTALSKRLDGLTAKRGQVEAQLAVPNLSSLDRDTLTAQRDALVNQYRITYDRFISLGDKTAIDSPLFTLQKARAQVIDAPTYRAAVARGATGTNHLTGDITAPAVASLSASAELPKGPVALGCIGALLGLLVGIGIAVVRSRFDYVLRTRGDFEQAYGLPILGGVPLLSREESQRHAVKSLDEPYSPAAEVYRAVRSALLLLGQEQYEPTGALTVMIASAAPSEGKTTSCVNLAVAFAKTGRSVLVVNCDYRRPTLASFFAELEDVPGRIARTAIAGLSVVTTVSSASEDPGRIVRDQATFIERQRDAYDVILLDTSPLLNTSDPIDLFATVDVVLLVGRQGVTAHHHAAEALELLERHQVAVAGLLMTAVAPAGNDYYSYYAAYTSSASHVNADKGTKRRKRGRKNKVAPPQPASEPTSDLPESAEIGWRAIDVKSNGSVATGTIEAVPARNGSHTPMPNQSR